jgi:hypothetical protein
MLLKSSPLLVMSLWNVRKDMFIILHGLKFNLKKCALTAESKNNKIKTGFKNLYSLI